MRRLIVIRYRGQACEQVANPWDGLDDTALAVPKYAPNVAHVLHERVVSHRDAEPDCLKQFCLRHRPAGAPSQMAQHLHRLRAKREQLSVAGKRSADRIERVALEPENAGGRAGHRRSHGFLPRGSAFVTFRIFSTAW